MAGTPVGTGLPKPSFAKVAALASSKGSNALDIASKSPPSIGRPNSSKGPHFSSDPPTGPKLINQSEQGGERGGLNAENRTIDDKEALNDIKEGVKALELNDETLNPEKRALEQPQSKSTAAKPGIIFESDQLPNSTSTSDLLTNPSSLDGKSFTSGTTFTLDEKESLRPDDSASVVAAEDEFTFSPPGSGAASSRVGSEAEARAFRDQFSEVSERIGPSAQCGPIPTQMNHISAPVPIPQIVSIPHAPDVTTKPASPGIGPFQNSGAPYGCAQQAPDEKLLEALESPKDRLFLLRLEQELIEFVNDPKKPDTLDLPPSNSFYRLLAHKLADYYFLTHFVDNAVNAVRLFRTPFCRLPPLLTSLSNPPTSGNTPPPATAFKIMQRGDPKKVTRKPYSEGNTAASSEAPSKSASELGGNSSEDDENGAISAAGSVSAKEKATLTREEREAKYKEARERIFKGFEESESGDVTAGDEDDKDVSRSSSNAGKKKNRKYKNAKDDGFEARSQFNAYYPSMHYSLAGYSGAPPVGAYYNPYPSQDAGAGGHMMRTSSGLQHPYNMPYAPAGQPEQVSAYSVQPQHYYPGPFNNSDGHIFNHGYDVNYDPSVESQQMVPMFNQPNLISHHSTNSPPSPVSTHGQYSSQMPPNANRQWQTLQFQSPYQNRGIQHTQSQVHPIDRHQFSPPAAMSSQGQYPYGQLPNVGSPDLGQHPVPGSYNRQVFNPQTQSFVPGDGYTGYNSSRPNSQHHPSNIASPPLNYFGGSQVPMRMQSTAPSSSRSSGYSSPQAGQVSNGRFSAQGHENVCSSYTPMANQQPGQSSLSKWGTPSHLPPKPPPPQPSSYNDNMRSLPQHVQATTNFNAANSGLPPTPQGSQYRASSMAGNASLPILDPGIRLGQRSSGSSK